MCISADDDHSSDTETDDDSADIKDLQKYMENIIHLNGQYTYLGENEEEWHDRSRLIECGAKEYHLERLSRNLESKLNLGLPCDNDVSFDHHSSEEELDVINNSSSILQKNNGQFRYSEKRKWSEESISFVENPYSSDEEFLDLTCVSAPVKFRSSPPANVHRPIHSQSSKSSIVFHSSTNSIQPHELYSISPRKRHCATMVNGGRNTQRPCLDFEKMQQIQVRLL